MPEKTCHGSCLCGTVRWRMEPPFTAMSHCHCSMCRKAHGAPFATYMGARPENFAFESGEDAVVIYESSPEFPRGFCGTCGSAVPVAHGDLVDVPAGGLDDDPGVRPEKHIFATHKAPWHEIAGSLPQLPTYKEDGSGLVVERPDPGPAREGVLRGSCLCGDAAYEVTGAFAAVFNCHCRRCQKARAAAHTTNGFTEASALRYTKGAELIERYELSEAKSFGQSFCSVCGSGMPRADVSEGPVFIPFGSLDDDPGKGADCHIFTAYKAPWYEIEDTLPQHEERPPRG